MTGTPPDSPANAVPTTDVAKLKLSRLLPTGAGTLMGLVGIALISFWAYLDFRYFDTISYRFFVSIIGLVAGSYFLPTIIVLVFATLGHRDSRELINKPGASIHDEWWLLTLRSPAILHTHVAALWCLVMAAFFLTMGRPPKEIEQSLVNVSVINGNLLISQNSADLNNVNLSISVIDENSNLHKYKRFWTRWPAQEVKMIELSNSCPKPQKCEVVGGGYAPNDRFRIDWSFGF